MGLESLDNTAEAWNLLSSLVTLSLAEEASETDKPATAQLLASLNLPEPSSPKWRALDEVYWRGWFRGVLQIPGLASDPRGYVLGTCAEIGWCDA